MIGRKSTILAALSLKSHCNYTAHPLTFKYDCIPVFILQHVSSGFSRKRPIFEASTVFHGTRRPVLTVWVLSCNLCSSLFTVTCRCQFTLCFTLFKELTLTLFLMLTLNMNVFGTQMATSKIIHRVKI